MSFIFDSSDISNILKLDFGLYPKDSFKTFKFILADPNPGSATKSYVNNFFNETEPSDSVTPAALEETNSGQLSSTNDFASLPQ